MIENSIDKKEKVFTNGEIIVDLTKSCFIDKNNNDLIYTVRRVPYDMIMRMDLISNAQYGSDEYTDLLLKYNDISNPFTLNYNDIIFIPTLDSISNNIVNPTNDPNDNNKDAALVRNYHKYIDKTKAPTTVGSQKNNISIDKELTEPNMSPEDTSPIVLRNGRIYFDNNNNVECSTNGISASDFNIQKIKNEI